MKTPQDPRHQRRISLMQKLFSYSFENSREEKDINHIISHLSEIDDMIRKSAPEWPIEKIAKVDLAILRLAVYELAIERKEPPKVIIDEAVELAKAFANPNSPAFVNGALGAVLQKLTEQQEQYVA
ncbi:MAG: transcription antitermination factor NusB [Patescibacteria group bacterium]|nr:transcription antitermination factor NusB [Patescibacteria group bacterium]